MRDETLGTRLLVPLDELSATGQQFRSQASQIEEQVSIPFQATEQAHGLGWSGQTREQYLTLHQGLVSSLSHVQMRIGTLGTQLSHHASYYAVLNAMRFGGTPGVGAVEGGVEPRENERVAGRGQSAQVSSTIESKIPIWENGQPCRGILDTGTEQIDLVSGRDGPSSRMPPDAPGMHSNLASRTHVEAHAAALMRERGLKEATLYINLPPCGIDMDPPLGYGCDDNLPHMLPENATLHVYYRNRGTSGWEVKTYTGLPDSDWKWPLPRP